MISISRSIVAVAGLVGLGLMQVTTGQAQQSRPRQTDEISLTLFDSIGTQPNFAVPDCLTLSPDEATAEAARTIGQVLWDDLEFEGEFRMISRDIYRTIPVARSLADPPFPRWRELGADGVVSCTVEATSNGQLDVTVRLFSVRSEESAYGVGFTIPTGGARRLAHQVSDEIHRDQRGLAGVARTRIAFVSDRDSESVLGLVENRAAKEIYIADYDGAGVRRVTVTRILNSTPAWSPDGRSIAYMSYPNGFPDVIVSYLYEGRMTRPGNGTVEDHNFTPAFSPDGRQIAFWSNRHGNPDIYIMNVDGTAVRQLTSNPAIDESPTWSPNGQQIAFISDRTGAPQVFVIGADGTGEERLTYESYASRPTWSPPPFNEIAFAARTGPGFDIKVLDLATRDVRQLTFGLGSNESPSYSPNGRHVAFTSTRGSGLKQIYTIRRDGNGLSRVTSTGNNEMASWSR